MTEESIVTLEFLQNQISGNVPVIESKIGWTVDDLTIDFEIAKINQEIKELIITRDKVSNEFKIAIELLNNIEKKRDMIRKSINKKNRKKLFEEYDALTIKSSELKVKVTLLRDEIDTIVSTKEIKINTLSCLNNQYKDLLMLFEQADQIAYDLDKPTPDEAPVIMASG